jgi:hypothetical protein
MSRVRSDSYLISRLIRPGGTDPPYFPAIRSLCMGYMLSRCTYGLSFWRPSARQLHRIQFQFLRPFFRQLHLPWHTNHLGLLTEVNCPSLHRYRQACMVRYAQRLGKLEASGDTQHPAVRLWREEWDQIQHMLHGRRSPESKFPCYTHTLPLQLHILQQSEVRWRVSRAHVAAQGQAIAHATTGPFPDPQLRPADIAMRLTISDYHSTPHRDDTDPTWLRDYKPSPGRSHYLYYDDDRAMTSLRARLRLNRANTAINRDRGKPLVLANHSRCPLCHTHTETVSHMLLECTHSRSTRARTRLTRQLIRAGLCIRSPEARSSDSTSPISLATVLGIPHVPLTSSGSIPAARRDYITLLALTNSYLRSICFIRQRAEQSPL